MGIDAIMSSAGNPARLLDWSLEMKKSTVKTLARSARPVCIAQATTNAGHRLTVCVAAHGDVLTFKAVHDGSTVQTLSAAFERRRRVTDEQVSAVASRLVNALEGYDRDAVETFADSLIGGWEFDYSAHVGAALDRLAAAGLLK